MNRHNSGLLNHFRKCHVRTNPSRQKIFTRIAGRCGHVFDPRPTGKYSPKRLGRCRFGRPSYGYRLIATPNRGRKAYAVSTIRKREHPKACRSTSRRRLTTFQRAWPSIRLVVTAAQTCLRRPWSDASLRRAFWLLHPRFLPSRSRRAKIEKIKGDSPHRWTSVFELQGAETQGELS